MPRFAVTFRDSNGVERDVRYVVEAVSARVVWRELPRLMADHQARNPHPCTVDSWSIVGRHERTGLPRPVAVGGIADGLCTNAPPNTHQLARATDPRDNGHSQRP
jgi:hypothetical protein